MKRYTIYRSVISFLMIIVCLSGCGYACESSSEATTVEAITVTAEQEDNSLELYVDEPQYRYEIQTIELEDIAKESILCENILADVKNGYDNEEICKLYEDTIVECEDICEKLKDSPEGEALPLQIDYAEYDINSDGLEDYIVLLSGCGYGGTAGIPADILLRQEDEEFVWVNMPVSRYNEGPTEDSQYFIMLLDSGDERYPWLLFANRDGLSICGLDKYESQESYKYTEHAVNATILQKEEMKEGIHCKVTEVFTKVGVTEWQHQAWIRVLESPQEKGISQIVTGECSHMVDPDRESSLDNWDVNDDGFVDVVYDEGMVYGSGGSFSQYRVFVWDEQGDSYKEYHFPLINRIDKENHKLFVAYQSGAPNQYYVIYGLRNGQYESFKELHLKYEYDAICDEEGNYIYLSKAIYSEWGEIIEETDITGLDWNETKELLEGKYPEFNFWREG